MEEDRRRGRRAASDADAARGGDGLDETLVAALAHAVDPDSTADDGIPVLLASDPRVAAGPPSSMVLETTRTPNPETGAMPEPSLDQTSEWGGARRESSVEAIGRVVAGRYLLGPVLGAGGMGTVFHAEHTDLGKRVAIKVLATALEGEAEPTARFLREAKAASTIESEHIAQVFDVGEDLHLGLYMVMELLKGEDLSRVLAARGALPPAVAAGIVWQVSLALERAHSAGVVHRDLKPANVFLTRGDDGSVKVKVLDFGIAKLVHDARSLSLGITRHGIVVGTPHYMSPEQAQGLETVDHRTDIYSLGVLLFETIAGSPPYPERENYEQTLYSILCEDPPRLASKVPGVLPELDELVSQLMARVPERRPASAREVRRRLAAIFPSLGRRTLVLGGSAPSVPTPVVVQPRTGSGVTVDSKPEPPARAVRGSKPALLVVAAALAFGSVLVTFLVVRSAPSGNEDARRALPSAQAAAVQVTGGVAPAPPATGAEHLRNAEEQAASLVREAQRALERGDASSGRDLAAEATRRAPSSGEAWLTLGAALEALHDGAAARAAYQTCASQADEEHARECAALLAR